jgi:hypothetical protein
VLAGLALAPSSSSRELASYRWAAFRTADGTVGCYYTPGAAAYLICQGRNSPARYLKRRRDGRWNVGISRARIRWSASLPSLAVVTRARDEHWRRDGIECYVDISSSVLQTMNCWAMGGMFAVTRFDGAMLSFPKPR